MAIATASIDFDPYDRHVKPTADGPALEALKSCAVLRSASPDALRALARQATIRPIGRGSSGTDSLCLPRRQWTRDLGGGVSQR
jgi:hypothetical protein